MVYQFLKDLVYRLGQYMTRVGASQESLPVPPETEECDPMSESPTRSHSRQVSRTRPELSPAAQLLGAPLVVIPFVVLALTLSAPTTYVQAQGLDRTEVAAIDSVFQEWMDPAGPGAAVAILRDGHLIYSQGYGSAHLEYRIPVSPTTIFHTASISKQFTAFAVALLARDGKLNWDDELHRHLPELPELGHPITLRQLANHTSGIRDQWQLLVQAGWRMDDVITRDQIMRLMLRQSELNFEPGSAYLYSNMGYSLLAEVVERTSGQDFGDFLLERVFLPLGMHRTHIHSDHTRVIPGRAYSYTPVRSNDTDSEWFGGAGGTVTGWSNAVLSYANQGATSLFTTVEDLTRWTAELERPRIGDSALWEEMKSPAILTTGDSVPYALGLAVSEYRGLKTVGHGGADAGFRTNLLYFPEERVGVVVFGNASSFDAGGTARRVATVLLDEEMGPREEDELEAKEFIEVSDHALEEWVGRYRLASGKIVEIDRSPDGLALHADAEEVSALKPESTTEFWLIDVNSRITFESEEDATTGFSLRHAEGEMQARKLTRDVPTEADLEPYTGTFYSPELDVVYRLRLQDGGLWVERPRHPASELFALADGRFGSSSGSLSTLAFSEGNDGQIAGFRISSGRVRNLRFERVEEPTW